VHSTLLAAPRDLNVLRQICVAQVPYAGTPLTALALSPRLYVTFDTPSSVVAEELSFTALHPHWARPVPELLPFSEDEVSSTLILAVYIQHSTHDLSSVCVVTADSTIRAARSSGCGARRARDTRSNQRPVSEEFQRPIVARAESEVDHVAERSSHAGRGLWSSAEEIARTRRAQHEHRHRVPNTAHELLADHRVSVCCECW
jgi:hypothetical protein